MTDPIETEDQNKNKPLLPRTIGGASIVAIPIASILSGFGYLSTKLLSLDEEFFQFKETVSTIQSRQEKHEAQLISQQEHIASADLKTAEQQKELDSRRELFEKSLRDLVTLDESTVRAAARQEEIKQSLDDIETRQIDVLQRVSKVETAIEYIHAEQQARRGAILNASPKSGQVEDVGESFEPRLRYEDIARIEDDQRWFEDRLSVMEYRYWQRDEQGKTPTQEKTDGVY